MNFVPYVFKLKILPRKKSKFLKKLDGTYFFLNLSFHTQFVFYLKNAFCALSNMQLHF